ncbi:hypothetical protein [Shinella sp. DD12]|uniref:hypothetical protein n=1 Tax=Shinella sp. DD12 TaxID=1410620 RepID=UPI000437CA93|nr:hypothetical protein [Shinella sp. DD12]EYR81792.1 hypothetical protein SHLA_4c000830 [Shinella sp. DD12]
MVEVNEARRGDSARAAIELIEKALEGVTPGRWGQFHPSYAPEAVGTPFSTWDTSHDLSAIKDGKKFGRIATFKHSADAAYLAACNPVAMSAILAEARKAEAMGLDRKRETQLATDMASDCLYEQKRREAAEARIAELEAFLSKLCDYHDADYVPNALFARARTLLNGGSDAQG